MARVRCITEMGMGVDVHGKDATKAESDFARGKQALMPRLRQEAPGFATEPIGRS